MHKKFITYKIFMARRFRKAYKTGRKLRKSGLSYRSTGPQATMWALRNSGKALSIAKGVAAIVNAEKQHFDVTNTTAPTTTGAFFPVIAPPEGDDIESRTGRSIKLNSCYFKFNFTATTANTSALRLRLVIMIDWYGLGALPAWTDIWEDSTIAAYRQIDTQNPSRYKILYNKVLSFPTSAGGNQMKYINIYKALKHHVRFISAAATQASMGSGQVYVGYVTDGGVGGTQTLTANWNCRTRYYDN